MKTGVIVAATFWTALSALASVDPLPGPPIDPLHPGSRIYSRGFVVKKVKLLGRDGELFLPEPVSAGERVPIVVFGHGQAMSGKNYRDTFEHLAKKGIASYSVPFDKGFFDRDFERMGRDYATIVMDLIKSNSTLLDPERLVYSGHSKGAYVALNAAGIANAEGRIEPRAIVLFSAAGFDLPWLRSIAPEVPITLVVGEEDKIAPLSLSQEIYGSLSSHFKQLIIVRSYRETNPRLSAGHFLSASSGFGARTGPFHFHGVWKWLGGAVADLSEVQRIRDPYLYGEQASSSGVNVLSHSVMRNW